MSRQILISAVYGNGKKCNYGVFSGQNAAYKSSLLHADGLKQKIADIKKEIAGKKVKKFVVWSMTSDAQHWTDHGTIEWVSEYKNLHEINAESLVNVNTAQFIATI